LADEFDKKRDEIRAAQKKDPAFVKLQEEIKTARDTRNREKIQELRPKMAEYQKPIIDLRKQTMDKVRALLTPEQIKTLDAARERLQERRGGHGGNGPAGGPPPPPPPKED
jgi:Spy/CpxP family protein refolding chaperone